MTGEQQSRYAVTAAPSLVSVQCNYCGAFISDKVIHDLWHDALDARSNT